MPPRGRPRLGPEVYAERLSAYCTRYGVAPSAEGLAPFPTGRRETPQHREWIALYKAHSRLARRERGQCERCESTASDGSIYCAAHRPKLAPRAGAHSASLVDRRRLLRAQRGRCPICNRKLDIADASDHSDASGDLRAVLHHRCGQLVGLAEPAGPDVLERLRGYLWPRSWKGRKPGAP